MIKNNKTYELVIISICIALTYVATSVINIRLPFMGQGGLIHLGNVPLFVAGMLFGKKVGALSGSFGMASFDLTSGWGIWAPFTFIIVGIMGYCIGVISEKRYFKNMILNDVLCIIVAIVIKVIGYYFAEVILTNNWILPFGSILGNIIQVAVAGVIALCFVPLLRKAVR